MTSFTTALGLLLASASAVVTVDAISTPIRDLSLDDIPKSPCHWSTFEEDDDLNGVMVLYQGQHLKEWRNPDASTNDYFGLNFKVGTTQHSQYSITKTWVSVLIGMLYRDGYLNWSTQHPNTITLGDIFSDDAVWDEMWDIPYPFHGGSKVPELKAITLGELMSMRTGYSEMGVSNPFDDRLVRDLDRLVAWWHPQYRMGTIESQTCFECGDYLASVGIVNYVIKEATKTASNPRGWDPLDYARQTSASLPNNNVGLFEALGMERGSYTWDRDDDNVARAAFGLWIDLQDMAKFGQLLLQGGKVSLGGVEKVVIPSYYFTEMTTTQSRISGYPYGWQVWNWGEDNENYGGGFCAEGLGWQSICAFPNDDMVVAIQAPVSFGIETFFSNIGFRNEALTAIRSAVVCNDDQAIITTPPPPPPPPPPTTPITPAPPADDGTDNGNGVGDGNTNNNNVNDNNKGGDNGETTDSSNLESGVQYEEDDKEKTRVGLLVAIMMTLAILSAIVILICCIRRHKAKQRATQQARVVALMDKMRKTVAANAEWDRAYDSPDINNNGNDDTGSVHTEDGDNSVTFAEVTIAEYDIEESSKSSTTK